MQFIIQHIWLVMGFIVVISAIGAFMFLKSKSRIMDWLKPNSEKYIPCKKFCEDKQIRDRKLKVETYCITDEKQMTAYHLDHELLCTSDAGNQFLCINERDDFPIDFNGKLTPEKRKEYPNAQRVYIDTANDVDNKATTETTKNFMGMTLSLIALGVAVVFVVIAIIYFWQARGGGV